MMENELSENKREQTQGLEDSEVDKLKPTRKSTLFLAVLDGIATLMDETRKRKESTKSVDKLDESGLALLHQVAQYNRTEEARSLLDDGAEIDVRSREDNLTPLHIAARLVNLSRELMRVSS